MFFFFCSWCLVRIGRQTSILDFWFLILKIVITKTACQLSLQVAGRDDKTTLPCSKTLERLFEKKIHEGFIDRKRKGLGRVSFSRGRSWMIEKKVNSLRTG